jgi:cytochrome c-type biogenesis protein
MDAIALYQWATWADQLVNRQLEHITPLSLAVVFAAGLLTSFSPCLLSMLPISIAYIGGYTADNRLQAAIQSLWFTLGLATTLAVLGLIAAGFGKIYGQVGWGLPVIVSILAIVMGLNLLQIIQIPLPAWGSMDWIKSDLPAGMRSYLVGLSFGVVASPCSTPVLATLLGWVAKQQNLTLGALLLLTYSIGYATPLIIAGTFTATIKHLLSLRRWSSWITPASGVILIVFGVFSLLGRLA